MKKQKSDSYAFELEDARTGGPTSGDGLTPSQRAWEEALEQAAVLLRRMEVAEPLIEATLGHPKEPDPFVAAFGGRAGRVRKELRNNLAQLASDVILNARWYQAKVARVERQLRNLRMLAVGCGLVILGLFGGMVFLAPKAGTVDGSTVWIAQISMFGTLFYGLLKSMAAGVSTRRQYTAFWAAGADLKELLYTFEHAWRGKLDSIQDLAGPDFLTALYEELRNARNIVRTERSTFFEAMATPEEIFSAPSALIGESATSAAALASARAALQAQQTSMQTVTAQDIATTRRTLIDQKAKLAATQKGLDDAKTAGRETATYEQQVRDAQSAVDETSIALRMKLKVARVNPD